MFVSGATNEFIITIYLKRKEITYSRIMNLECRQTSDPTWLAPKDPAVKN